MYDEPFIGTEYWSGSDVSILYRDIVYISAPENATPQANGSHCAVVYTRFGGCIMVMDPDVHGIRADILRRDVRFLAARSRRGFSRKWVHFVNADYVREATEFASTTETAFTFAREDGVLWDEGLYGNLYRTNTIQRILPGARYGPVEKLGR